MRFFVLLFVSASVHAQAATDIPYYGDRFYQGVLGTQDERVKSILKEVLLRDHRRRTGRNDELVAACKSADCYRHTSIGYNKARVFLFGEYYLVKDGAQYGVREVYCQRVYEASEFRGTKPGPGLIPDAAVMNAEHTWPQSKFTKKYSADLQKSDLHHLFPSDSHMNSSRSSHPFGDVSKNDERLKCPESRLGSGSRSENVVFEPPPAHKGNVARALFYFSIRYDTPIAPAEEAAMRAWHEADPVDDDEMRRNEAIFQLQKNRNPFVDFPELVSRILDF